MNSCIRARDVLFADQPDSPDGCGLTPHQANRLSASGGRTPAAGPLIQESVSIGHSGSSDVSSTSTDSSRLRHCSCATTEVPTEYVDHSDPPCSDSMTGNTDVGASPSNWLQHGTSRLLSFGPPAVLTCPPRHRGRLIIGSNNRVSDSLVRAPMGTSSLRSERGHFSEASDTAGISVGSALVCSCKRATR